METLFVVSSILFLLAMGVAYWEVRRLKQENRDLRRHNRRLWIQCGLYRDRVQWSEDRVRGLKEERISERRLI